MSKSYSTIFTLLLATLGLAGCSNKNAEMVALQDYASAQLNRSGGVVEPLPEFTAYQPFTYGAAGLRGPFDAPIVVSTTVRNNGNDEISPDESREKELLENFSMASLKMVGSMSGGRDLWVLIQDETAAIHKVVVGDYLGRNYGQVVAANSAQIEIIEIVPSGEGWIERPQIIKLNELGEQ